MLFAGNRGIDLTNTGSDYAGHANSFRFTGRASGQTSVEPQSVSGQSLYLYQELVSDTPRRTSKHAHFPVVVLFIMMPVLLDIYVTHP